MPTVLLYLSGIAGPDDERRIRQALLAERGVLAVVASEGTGCAEIDIEDDLVSVDRLIEVLENQGYGVRLGG